MPKFIIKISNQDQELLNNDDICCYLADSGANASVLKQAKASDKLVLAMGEDAPEFCINQDLDGVMTTNVVDEKFPKYLKNLQKQIGIKKFLGISCEASRHCAMIASEAEPAFVAFNIREEDQEAAIEMLEWYAELFLIQSALFYHEKINDNLLNKTDFLIINTKDYKILVDKIERLD